MGAQSFLQRKYYSNANVSITVDLGQDVPADCGTPWWEWTPQGHYTVC